MCNLDTPFALIEFYSVSDVLRAQEAGDGETLFQSFEGKENEDSEKQT